jgi:exopolyphosphatase/guanosine-5'-triphosphate,3'-diphosphate pyrophosphatase
LTSGYTVLAEVGGGNADISLLRDGEPTHSGTYALGAIRLRQTLAAWSGSQSQQTRLMKRHIHNVVEDIRSEMPLKRADSFVALGGDVRLAAFQILGEPESRGAVRVIPRGAFLDFCEAVTGDDVEDIIERFQLSQADAETLVPALLAYRELLLETEAPHVTVPEASLRGGLLLDLAGGAERPAFDAFRKQVLASAAGLGEKYRYHAEHARHVAHLATQLYDALQSEHGLGERERLLLEVASLLHDIGLYISLRGHHKHAQYILSVSQIFGLSRDEMAVVGNVARYHRRGVPQKSHPGYAALDSAARVVVNKLAALLRVANALDADHARRITDVDVVTESDAMVLAVRGTGDLTMERAAVLHRCTLLREVFGRRVVFREVGGSS